MAASIELLGELHGLVATELTRRIQSGEATAADIAQAIKLLKDNNISAIPTDNNPLGKLVDNLKAKLPFTTDDSPLLN